MGKKKQAPKNATTTNAVQNGLGDAIGYPSTGFGPGAMGSAQISNTGTIFKNLRYYLVSNFRPLLSQAYIEIGLIQTIVDVPVDDALRGGVEIKSKQLDEEQIEELQTSLDRDNDLLTAGQAAKWNRLFGGAGLLIITEQDPKSPLDLDAIKPDSLLEFRAVDMWELYGDKQNIEDFSMEGEEGDSEFYSYYSHKVHQSRVLPMRGMTAPSFIRPRLRGWGFSVVEALVRSINQYLKATDLGFEVLDEFKLDVYKVKNLVNTLMSANGEQQIHRRVQMANWQKNYQHAIVMDSEDDFDHKQLSFSGLAEAMSGIRMQIAADMRMPITKLFGISAAGFNSGEDDIEVYNSMIESQVRSKLKYDLLRICELKCQKLFGMIPDDLSISFKPLRVMSAEQEENVKTSKFNRLLAAKQAGEITTHEFREACNRDDLLTVTLDTSGESLNPDDPEIDDLLSGNDEDVAAEEGESDGEAKEASSPGKPSSLSAPKTPSVKNKKHVDPLKVSSAERKKLWEESTKTNSAEYDKAAYEVDGGDSQYAPGREPFFEDAKFPDKSLLSQAKEASTKAFGKVKWQFVAWWYKREGGSLHE